MVRQTHQDFPLPKAFRITADQVRRIDREMQSLGDGVEVRYETSNHVYESVDELVQLATLETDDTPILVMSARASDGRVSLEIGRHLCSLNTGGGTPAAKGVAHEIVRICAENLIPPAEGTQLAGSSVPLLYSVVFDIAVRRPPDDDVAAELVGPAENSGGNDPGEDRMHATSEPVSATAPVLEPPSSPSLQEPLRIERKEKTASMPKRAHKDLNIPHSRVYEEELREVVAILDENGQADFKVDGEPATLDGFLASTAPWDELEIQGSVGASVTIRNSGFVRTSTVHDWTRHHVTPSEHATAAALRSYMVLTRNADHGLRFLAANYWRNFIVVFAVMLAVVVWIMVEGSQRAGALASTSFATVLILYNVVVFGLTQREVRLYKRKHYETVRHRYSTALKKGDPMAVLGLVVGLGTIVVGIWQIIASSGGN